jgi:hypothetical protein
MSEAASGYERQDLEKYFTPAWVTEALIGGVGFEGSVWDPAGGAGHIIDVFHGLGYRGLATDISPDRCDVDPHDFFSFDGTDASIITNPPFGSGGRLAVAFIDQALKLTKPHGGKVAMLLRVDFDSAKGRRRLFADHPAFACKLVLTKRIRWTNLPQSAAGPTQNHAWFLWDWSKAPGALPTIGYLP